MNKLVGIVLLLIALVGLFVWIQREEPAGTGPIHGGHDEEEPRIQNYEPRQGEPQLVAPGTSPASGGATGQSGSGARAVTDSSPGNASPGSSGSADGRTDTRQSLSSQPGGSAGSVFSDPSAVTSAAGPGASTDPSAPVTDMISLPPSGPGPDDSAVGAQSPSSPAHGSTENLQAPEAGSDGIMGPGPELLPVTHPGPSGELPQGDPGPGPGPAPEQ